MAYPDAEFIDAKGGVIMPAFINTHEHIYSAMARGLSINGYNPQGFLDILDGMWWTIDRHLTLEQTRQSALATYLDSLFTMYLPDEFFAQTEDITREGIIGNYVHGNEPSHHVAYLYLNSMTSSIIKNLFHRSTVYCFLS